MDNRIVYAAIVFLFNSYGIASLLNGNAKKCIFAIISSFITCGIIGFINAIKGILMAIKIFQMTDEEFAAADKASFEDLILLFYKD